MGTTDRHIGTRDIAIVDGGGQERFSPESSLGPGLLLLPMGLEERGTGLFFSDVIAKIFSRRSLDRIEARMGRAPLALITAQLPGIADLVGRHGEEAGFRFVAAARGEIHRFLERLPGCRLLALENLAVDECLTCLCLDESELRRLPDTAMRLQLRLAELLHAGADGDAPRMDARVGYAWIEKHAPQVFYQALFKSLCDARRIAAAGIEARDLEWHHRFLDLLENPPERGGLRVVYQPICHLGTRRVLGWEIYLRGPSDTDFHAPRNLLAYAEKVGQVVQVELRCLVTGLRECGGLSREQTLFLNCHPHTLNAPRVGEEMARLVRERGLEPERVAIEFSAADIKDIHLTGSSLRRFQDLGFQLSLGDLGSDQASFRAISALRPRFIKISPSLVRDVDKNPIKRVMVESLVILSRKIGATAVAEGIESGPEMDFLMDMGVEYGQGFHIARPAFPRPDIVPLAPLSLRNGDRGADAAKCASPVESLQRPVLTVPPETPVSRVKELISGQGPICSVVVVRDERPLGLVMNYNLDRKLSTPYGVSLYYHRSIARIMDEHPLVVDREQPVEEVAKAAMNRSPQKVYDDIVVTAEGRYTGVISVQRLLDHMAEVQVKIAMGANPLTGLPGNVIIEQEINRRATHKVASSLLYIDLDNFKVYNDVYGFDNGDKVLLFTATAIRDAVNRAGCSEDFVGHVGGDDFVVIAGQSQSQRIAELVVESFGKSIDGFYRSQDRDRGYIVGRGRDGAEGRFPFISVSIGIVDCAFECPIAMDELSLRVAEIKKYAKSVRGNSFVRDRRAPLGSAPSAEAA